MVPILVIVLFDFQIQDQVGDEFLNVTLAENVIADIKALDGGELLFYFIILYYVMFSN